MTNSEQERKQAAERLRAVREEGKKSSVSKAAAMRLLIEAGIYTRTGRLAKRYR